MKQLVFKHNPHLFQLAWALIRTGSGRSFIFQGYSKRTGGARAWKRLGDELSLIGIDFWLSFRESMTAFARLGEAHYALDRLFTHKANA